MFTLLLWNRKSISLKKIIVTSNNIKAGAKWGSEVMLKNQRNNWRNPSLNQHPREPAHHVNLFTRERTACLFPMYASYSLWADSLKWMNEDSDVKVEAGQVPVLSMMGHTSIQVLGSSSDLERS